MYKVWNENNYEWMEVNEKWMEGVNTKDAKEYNYSSTTDKLEVVYKNGESVYYQNVHGTWGFPVIVK